MDIKNPLVTAGSAHAAHATLVLSGRVKNPAAAHPTAPGVAAQRVEEETARQAGGATSLWPEGETWCACQGRARQRTDGLADGLQAVAMGDHAQPIAAGKHRSFGRHVSGCLFVCNGRGNVQQRPTLRVPQPLTVGQARPHHIRPQLLASQLSTACALHPWAPVRWRRAPACQTLVDVLLVQLERRRNGPAFRDREVHHVAHPSVSLAEVKRHAFAIA